MIKEVSQVVSAIDEKDVVEVFDMAEVLVRKKRLSRPIAIHPEVQDIEAFFSLIQQIIQGFREGVVRGHTDVLHKGIAEEADVGGGSQIGLGEIPVLSEAEIVVVE